MQKPAVTEKGRTWGICANKQYLVLGCEENLLVYNLDTLKPYKKIESNENMNGVIRRCVFMPTENDIIGVCRFNGVCDILCVGTGKHLQRLEGPECEIKGLSFNEDGRLAMSTREGSVWVWKIEDNHWEIEEVIEYSENDVKNVVWHNKILITMGYCKEIVVYNLWESDICDVKWEMEQILTSDSTIWAGCVAENEGKSYFCCVTETGHAQIYGIEENNRKWKEISRVKISNYPIRSICTFKINEKELFAAIIDRQILCVFSCNGEILVKKNILNLDEEPIDIIYSESIKTIFILTFAYRKMCNYTNVHKIEVDKLGLN